MNGDPGGNSGGNGAHRDHPEYWCAYLAAAIGGALVTVPYEQSSITLRRALRDFTKSRECSRELRDIIRGIQKTKETHGRRSH